MKLMVVVDMQNDFVTGCLGSNEAKAIVEKMVKTLNEFDGEIVFTRDTHFENYMETMEGKKLPVPHCIKDSEGWQIIPELKTISEREDVKIFDKLTFGSLELASYVKDNADKYDEIELIGVCTDICVISNALLIKASVPNKKIVVDHALCAGVSPTSHKNALEAMKCCHIDII